jgi:transposase
MCGARTSRAAEPRAKLSRRALRWTLEGIVCQQVFKAWLGERDTSGRDGIEVVAMDGFTGFKTATNEDFPTRSR